jgi:hypothetical protein
MFSGVLEVSRASGRFPEAPRRCAVGLMRRSYPAIMLPLLHDRGGRSLLPPPQKGERHDKETDALFTGGVGGLYGGGLSGLEEG